MAILAPSTINDIIPVWLTEALRFYQYLPNDTSVISIKRTIIGATGGFASCVARLELTYDKPAHDAPISLVVKIVPEIETYKKTVTEFNYFEREIKFYEIVAPTSPLRVPKAYFTLSQPPNFLIAMEDLSNLQSGDQLTGLAYQQVENIAKAVAELQAIYWESESLANLEWMPTHNHFGRGFENKHWQAFLTVLGPYVSPEGIAAGEVIRQHIHWIEMEIDKAPKTIVHCDLREGNILFGPVNSPDEFVVVDWQVAIRSCGAYDIARLMGGSETAEQRQGHQFEILRCWYDTLVNSGVTNYSFKDAEYHFKLCAMSFCSIPVFFHNYMETFTDQYSRDLLISMAQRAFDSVIELNAIDILS